MQDNIIYRLELTDKEYEFIENLRKELYDKLSKMLNIPREYINICNFGTESVQYELLINENFAKNNPNLDPFISNDSNFEDLVNKLNSMSISQNSKINVKLSPLLEAMKLSTDIFDSRGNKNSGWSQGATRGGMNYDPPLGWSGHGLKVLQKYENDDWLGNTGGPGEWCVAYHGVASGQSSDNVKKVTGNIYKSSFKPGKGQAHEFCDDQFHPGQKVGRGVYCTRTIKTAADKYAGISEINGIKYKTVLMVRVKPEAIRHCDTCLDSKAPFDYWVVNGTTDEIRPYRILYQRCN